MIYGLTKGTDFEKLCDGAAKAADEMEAFAKQEGHHGATLRAMIESNIDLGKLQPVIFDSAKNEYRVVGEKVGTAWGAGKTIQEREVK